jgi:predicted MFS family arabinose efflux permease
MLLILVMALVQFTHIVDFMIVMPLGKQFMESMQISPGQFSMIVSSYAFSAFVMGLGSAMLVDRYDRKRALMVLYVGFTLGTLLCAFAPEYWTFLAARCMTGAFGGVLVGLVLSIIGDTFSYERRASATGWVMTAFSLASVLGVPAGISLAAVFGLRAPFFVIGLLSVGVIFLMGYTVPEMRDHFEQDSSTRRPAAIWAAIFADRNQVLALLFTVVLMLGHFSIIPFIAPYMQFNIGFSDQQVALIYLIGGSLTAVLLPVIGQIADRIGNATVFAVASGLALVSIFIITNLPPVTLVVALCATSSFFIVASGRSVPATTMVTSVVSPQRRASFMSVRTSVNNLALGLASSLAGLIVIEKPDHSLGNFEWVGYFAIAMSILAIWLAHKLKAIA